MTRERQSHQPKYEVSRLALILKFQSSRNDRFAVGLFRNLKNFQLRKQFSVKKIITLLQIKSSAVTLSLRFHRENC